MIKKIVAMSVMMAFLAVLCAKSAVAQPPVSLYVWTDSRQYAPGETGTLYITYRNDLHDTDLIIKNITIVYEGWQAYLVDHWEGNETFRDIDEICGRRGGVYNKEVTFTVPTDGRGSTTWVYVTVTPDEEAYALTEQIPISVVPPPSPSTIEDMDVWMTSLTVAMVICTIILAIVIFLSTRGARTPRMVAPPHPPKAKAE